MATVIHHSPVILDLPTELKQQIFEELVILHPRTLLKIRETCWDLYTNSTRIFLATYFTTLYLNSSFQSLDRLLEISENSFISKHVQAVFLSSQDWDRLALERLQTRRYLRDPNRSPAPEPKEDCEEARTELLALALGRFSNCHRIGTTNQTSGTLCRRRTFDHIDELSTPNKINQRILLNAGKLSGVRINELNLEFLPDITTATDYLQMDATISLQSLHLHLSIVEQPSKLLEAINKNPQLSHLNLQMATFLSHDSAVEAINIVLLGASLPVIRRLELHGYIESTALATFVANHPTLQELCLTDTYFHEEEWHTLIDKERSFYNLKRIELRRVGAFVRADPSGLGWRAAPKHVALEGDIQGQMREIVRALRSAG